MANDQSQIKEELSHALLQSLAMESILTQRPGLLRLLQDLRYQVQTEQLDDLGSLPVLTISAPISTYLPPDEIIIQNTQLSGIPSFEEVIDISDIKQMSDPIRRHLLDITQSLSQTLYREITV